MPCNPVETLCADVELSVAEASIAKLVPHATLAFKSRSPKPAWADPAFQGRLAYIVCTEDRAIPKFVQEKMRDATGQKWIKKELRGSHISPFVLKDREAVDIVADSIKAFLQEVTSSSSER